jgi:signal transduction histidine kinase
MTTVRTWIDRLDPWIVDAILALAVLVALELTCWLTSGVSRADRIVTAAAAVAVAAPIAIRRVRPGEALVIGAAVVLVSMLFGGQLLSNDNAYVIPLLVLGYSAGAGLDGRRSALALLLALTLLWAWALIPGPDRSGNGGGEIAWALFYVTLLVLPPWLIGRYMRGHSHRTRAFDALAAETAAAMEAQHAAAIAAEHARIGSELQDIIAHSVSAMVIQAGSARLLLRTDPGRARDSILSVEETGRQALSDLRRLLGMLRKDDDPRALSPQPGLRQVPALIDSLRDGELACEWRTVGDPADLTPGIDLVAYRVIEAALRAAADAHARHGLVTVRYEPRELALEVRADRRVADLGTTFAPLVERVALYHGELSTEPRIDGFALRARLPLEAGVPA